MNAQGSAGRAAGIVGALATLLLAHDAAAGDTMIVYGKRLVKPEVSELARPAVETVGILVALNDELRATILEDIQNSLRDGFDALRMHLAEEQGEAIGIKVASLPTRTGV